MLILALLLALPMRDGPIPVIQPFTVTSPSGEWALHVDPSTKYATGPARVEATRLGQRAWQRELAFTLREAVIDESGAAAGYSLTNGSHSSSDDGELVVAVFAPDGTSRLEEHHPLQTSRFLHTPANPRPTGLFAQPELDLFVVRVADEDVNRCDEEWWPYRLSTGEPLSRVRPKHRLAATEPLRMALGAHAIPGTPLTLVQWHRFEWESDGFGTRFVLVDGAWDPVWSLELPKDFRRATEDEEDLAMRARWERGDNVLAVSVRSFDLLHEAAGERVTFEVTAEGAAAGGWSVQEADRAPWVPDVPSALPVLDLQRIASTPLEVDSEPRSPVRDIESFDFDVSGNLHLVRRESEGGCSLLTLGPGGDVLRETRVADLAPDVEGRQRWHLLRNGRWLVTLRTFKDATRRAWFVDATTGAARELDGFAGPTVDEHVAAAPDGGFFVAGTYDRSSAMCPSLLAFDAAGARLWQILEEGYGGGPSDLLGVDGLAVLSDGSVLLLDNVRTALQVFDDRGQYVRTVDLESTWAGEGSYLSALLPAPDGAWLVHDFSTGTWRRCDTEGRELGRVVPRGTDGAVACHADSIRISPTGVLWGTDGEALFELDDAGVARARYGEPPQANALRKPTGLRIDTRGRLAVVDARSHAVHLFASTGVREAVLAPGDDDFDDLMADVNDILAASDGRTFVQGGFDDDRYLEFGPDGSRRGWQELGGGRVAFVPGTSERWVASGSLYDPIFVRRLAENGHELSRIERRPDNRFFPDVFALASGPDGSVAVLSGSGPRDHDLGLDVYAADGTPLRSLDLPAAPEQQWVSLSHGRDVLVASGYSGTALVVTLPELRPALVHVPDAEGTDCAFGLSPDGRELWCLTREPLVLHRLALP